MAFVPDEAVVDAGKVSSGAWRLYCYYCMKRNKDSNGWKCPKSAVLKEMPDFTKGTYFRVRKELDEKGWIRIVGDFVIPVKGFKSLKIETPNPENNEPDSVGEDVVLEENEGQEMGENGLNNETNSPKNETGSSLKNETDSPKIETPSLKNETPPLKESLPAHNTSPLNQEEKNKQKVSDEPSGDVEKFSVEMNEVFEHWQKVLKHPQATLDGKRKTILRARFREGYSVETLKAVIDGVQNSPWHNRKNPDRKQYHKFDTIFRNADQIETFVDLATPRAGPKEPDADIQVPAPMPFAELVFIAYDVNESEPTTENYEATKASYLGDAPSAELVEEVENYEHGNEYRQRFCKAGSGTAGGCA